MLRKNNAWKQRRRPPQAQVGFSWQLNALKADHNGARALRVTRKLPLRPTALCVHGGFCLIPLNGTVRCDTNLCST